MSLNIYTGNRMERLVAALAGVVAQPLSSPFAPEVIVVQSKGMQRWLAMQMAARFGVWANCDYPFPNKMIWQLFCKVFPTLPDTSPFSPEVLTWRVMGLLPGLLTQPEFVPLRQYLEGDRSGLKLFQLSGKIADTFDQYTLFRPEMLREWEAGAGGDEWQATLWQRLTSGGEGTHRGRLKHDFCRLLAERSSGEAALLPERISVFGISYLPLYHLDILSQVARLTEVNLFLLSPCREYWGDIMAVRDQARRAPEEREYLFEGNPLLASLGRLGRDFCRMVIEGTAAAAEEDLYADPGAATLLEAIQSDILNLRGAEEGQEKRAIAPDDRSIQIHSCHSPLREIEVLYDNLLALLEGDGGIAPRDIVVMTPDIESYAPYISLVFDGEQDPARRIPFSIADRSLAGEGQIAGLLLKLIALPGSRLGAASLFDILETEVVMRRFGLLANDLDVIRGWLEETRIRWGADEDHRAALGLPPYRENSWAAGLDRLLLGYAMPDDGGLLFNGVLPFDEMEGDRACILGRFADFVRAALAAAESLAAARSLGGWRAALGALLTGFVEADDDAAHELAAISGMVESLDGLAGRTGYGEEVSLEVIRGWLAARLATEEKGYGFMTGGVTFCAMLPMRSIPFRVVALVGMNDSAFPRQARPPGFDLIARHPRTGDRSLRDEDRYLFLECLLSARDCLYLSYVGQSIRDNSEIPPSVLVSEFLDSLGGAFFCEGTSVATRLVTKHRLQPFSRKYFIPGSGLTSYSVENCTALVTARDNPWQPIPFLATPLDEPPPEWREVPLVRLVRFFANPAKFLLESRLGIRLEDLAVPLEEREAFTIGGLDAYGVNEQILGCLMAGGDPAGLFPVLRAKGMLPPANHGRELFYDAVTETSAFAAAVRTECAGQEALPPWDFDLKLGAFTLSGRLDGILRDRKIAYRCARLKAKDQIRVWIEHLILNVVRPQGYPLESLLIMTDEQVSFGPVEDAEEILEEMLALYWQGLTVPLSFFPESAMAYADKLEWSLSRAEAAWTPYQGRAEKDDPYFRLCFGQDTPFDAAFEMISKTLLGPLVRHRR